MNLRSIIVSCLLLVSSARAEDITFATEKILRIPQPTFDQGPAEGAQGARLQVADRKVQMDGHSTWMSLVDLSFADIPEADWRDALVRCKADGIDLLSVPVRWSLHEPREGAFDWTRQHALARFLAIAHELHFRVILAVGPVSGSEAGQGTVPAWLSQRGVKPDSDVYLRSVRLWYGELARQLKGLRWKEGGPVIGVQLEGEFTGPAEHLLALKQLARSQGLELPLYLVSSQCKPSTPLPQGAFVSVPRKSPNGLWDSASMPGTDQLTVLRNNLPSTQAIGDYFQRRMNLFLREFGEGLANMETYLPKGAPLGAPASAYLRSDGNSGFVFIGNPAGARRDARFVLNLYSFETTLTLPQAPRSLPAGMRSVWPFNMPLSNKINLGFATAMPLCFLDDDTGRTVFMAASAGLPVDIGIAADRGVTVTNCAVSSSGVTDGNMVFAQLQPSHEPVMEIRAPGSPLVRIVILSEADSMNLFKVNWLGETRVVLWRGLAVDASGQLELYDASGRQANGSMLVYPAPRDFVIGTRRLQGHKDGLFTAYELGLKK